VTVEGIQARVEKEYSRLREKAGVKTEENGN